MSDRSRFENVELYEVFSFDRFIFCLWFLQPFATPQEPWLNGYILKRVSIRVSKYDPAPQSISLYLFATNEIQSSQPRYLNDRSRCKPFQTHAFSFQLHLFKHTCANTNFVCMRACLVDSQTDSGCCKVDSNTHAPAFPKQK